jgi:branched-chain amino acid transport system substrate-binding protein
MKKLILAGALSVLAAAATGVYAQSGGPVKLAYLGEISGQLAVSGGNFRDGVILATEEINAKGGIAGHKIELTLYDTQTHPGIARAQAQKALDSEPFAVLGPVLSGNVKVVMQMLDQAGVPFLIGGEAADLVTLGAKNMFRTSFGQQIGMPKIVAHMRDNLKAKTVGLIWVNNDFGKAGRDQLVKAMKEAGLTLAADISTEPGQVDFAADVVKLKAANADVQFIYSNEEECARIMREAKKQGLKGPFVGDTTLLSQKTIELAGDAANGVQGHVGLTSDAPIKAVEDYKARFQKRFNYVSDHNGIKGYTGVYALKYVVEKKLGGKIDSKAVAPAMHGLTITPADEPNILIETSWDNQGEIDRISFLAEVVDGKQKITKILPKLGK